MGELKSTFYGEFICSTLDFSYCMIVTWGSGVWRFVFPDLSALQIGGDGDTFLGMDQSLQTERLFLFPEKCFQITNIQTDLRNRRVIFSGTSEAEEWWTAVEFLCHRRFTCQCHRRVIISSFLGGRVKTRTFKTY